VNDLINSSIFWWVVLAAMVILYCMGFSKAYRKGGWKKLRYELKQAYNSLTYMVNMILAAYFIIISLIPISSIKSWASNQEALNSTVDNAWVYRSVPTVYSIFIIIIECWIIFKGLIPRIKLNEQEKQWDKDNRDKTNRKLKEWLHIKPKTEDIVK